MTKRATMIRGVVLALSIVGGTLVIPATGTQTAGAAVITYPVADGILCPVSGPPYEIYNNRTDYLYSVPFTSPIIGLTKIVGNGHTLWYIDDYKILSASVSGDVVQGYGVFAFLGLDPIYLEGGTGLLIHYGSVNDPTGPTLNVCAALGYPTPEVVSPTAATTAIQWAEQFLKPGSDRSKDSGYCLQFVSEAYEAAGIDIGTVGDANGAAYYWEHDKNGYPEHKEDTNPPIGALVFWGATPSGPISYVNPNGHVGIYIGDNTVISTWAYPEPKSDPYVFEFPLTGPGSRNAAGYPYLGWLSPTS